MHAELHPFIDMDVPTMEPLLHHCRLFRVLDRAKHMVAENRIRVEQQLQPREERQCQSASPPLLSPTLHRSALPADYADLAHSAWESGQGVQMNTRADVCGSLNRLAKRKVPALEPGTHTAAGAQVDMVGRLGHGLQQLAGAKKPRLELNEHATTGVPDNVAARLGQSLQQPASTKTLSTVPGHNATAAAFASMAACLGQRLKQPTVQLQRRGAESQHQQVLQQKRKQDHGRNYMEGADQQQQQQQQVSGRHQGCSAWMPAQPAARPQCTATHADAALAPHGEAARKPASGQRGLFASCVELQAALAWARSVLDGSIPYSGGSSTDTTDSMSPSQVGSHCGTEHEAAVVSFEVVPTHLSVQLHAHHMHAETLTHKTGKA